MKNNDLFDMMLDGGQTVSTFFEKMHQTLGYDSLKKI